MYSNFCSGLDLCLTSTSLEINFYIESEFQFFPGLI